MSVVVITEQPRPSSKAGDKLDLVDMEEIEAKPHSFEKDLDALRSIDYLHVQQQMELDLKAGCGAGNTYQIKNEDGQKLFYAVEDPNCFCRWVCGPNRMFHVTVYNLYDEPVLHLERSCCRCDWCCCFECCMCQHKLVVRDAEGNILGKIREKFHVYHLLLDIKDEEDETFLKVTGPCCACRCCTEMNFDIMDRHGNRDIGYIFKRYYGNDGKVNMDHENFEICIPPDLDVKEKAVLLGASFLVDFLYMENS